jgi:hypothetical protein
MERSDELGVWRRILSAKPAFGARGIGAGARTENDFLPRVLRRRRARVGAAQRDPLVSGFVRLQEASDWTPEAIRMTTTIAERESGARRERAARMDALRRAYFAHLDSGSSAIRFGVSVERLDGHLQGAFHRRSGTADPATLHLDDVALAAACVDDAAGAWSRLIERSEPALVTEARAFEDPTLAVITARRFLIEVRRATQSGGSMSLRRYAGGAPIGVWLGARLLTWRAGQSGASRSALRSASGARRLRGALQALQMRRRFAGDGDGEAHGGGASARENR